MSDLSVWQIVFVFLSVSGVILAPSIWFVKYQVQKTDRQTAALVESLNHTQEKASKETRDDLRDFRLHFDKRITEVYTSIDTKNKELREYIQTELGYIKNLISDIEVKLDITREKGHELEKELMRVQNDIQKRFVSKDHLDAMIKMQNKFEDVSAISSNR